MTYLGYAHVLKQSDTQVTGKQNLRLFNRTHIPSKVQLYLKIITHG